MMQYRDNNLPKSYAGDGNYVFISYSRKDKNIVYADLLEMNRLGVRFWYDDGIAAGENWREVVANKINSPKCVGVIFYLSKNTLFSEAIEAEIKMVFGAKTEEKKNNFALLIDYDNYSYSLDRVIESSLKGCNDIALLQRANLISSIFAGDINYLFRSSDARDLTKHFYKMILRILSFGAISIDVLNQLVPDYSDFEFKNLDSGLSISKYKGKEETVYIPLNILGKNVVEIGEEAFKDNNYVKRIYVPDSVTKLGSKSFYRCRNLCEVNFDINESKLETIGYKVFYDCFRLKKLHIPIAVKKIGTQAFGECEFSDQTVDELYFYSVEPPIFDMECADGSKLFVPVISKQKYIDASGLPQNIFSVLDIPANLSFKDNEISWSPVYGAFSYEIDEDDIPIKIVKDAQVDYECIDGLHTIKIRALGSFKQKILSSAFSEPIICGVTAEEEFSLNKEKDTVIKYDGVGRIVVLPEFIKKIKGGVLVFYNVTELYVPSQVSEIDYSAVCGIKKLIIHKDNPYFYTKDGKIYNRKTNEFFRDVVLGETYEYNGSIYNTETHMKVNK